MSKTTRPVTIKILDKEYIIACPDDERDALMESVQFLNGKCRDLQSKSPSIGTDRLLALTALNLAHDFLKNDGTSAEEDQKLKSSLLLLQEKIDNALTKSKQMEL